MLDEIRSMDWVPRSLRQKSTELERLCNSLEQRFGRFPTDEEIALELGIDLDEYFKLLDSIKGISFIPEDIHDVIRENREARFLASENDVLFQEVYRGELQQHLTEAITSLTEKEQLVLSLYYFEELTMKEVGNVMGYTESRISQIHTKAMLKLRTRLTRKLSPEDFPDHIDLSAPHQNGEKKRGRNLQKPALMKEV
jgi:RNA polymerase sigma factor for flagellar operon FliA